MPSTFRQRTLAILTLTAATAVALTGCFGGGEVRPGEDVQTVPEGVETVVDAVTFPDPAASEAGQTLGFGDTVWILYTTEAGDEEFSGVTVLDIQEGDPSFFEIFDNAEEFADYVPYYVFVQRKYTAAAEDQSSLTLWPVFADLTDASVIETTTFGMGTLTACGDFAVPEFEDAEMESVDCFVAASNTGEPVAGVRYDSAGKYTFVAPSGNPYWDAPIHWLAS